MRTRVYIDGYNFYFGCLKGTPYKWLDPVSLIETLLVRSGAPESILDIIHQHAKAYADHKKQYG